MNCCGNVIFHVLVRHRKQGNVLHVIDVGLNVRVDLLNDLFDIALEFLLYRVDGQLVVD